MDIFLDSDPPQYGRGDSSTGRKVLVNTADAQTLAQKTLTSPTITTPAISTPAVTGKPTTYSTVTTLVGATDAIDISLGDIFMLSRVGAVDAATLADPAVGDNGRIIRIMTGTAFAHTVTLATGIGGVVTTDDVITFTNRPAASITLLAHAGKWWVIGSYLAAIA